MDKMLLINLVLLMLKVKLRAEEERARQKGSQAEVLLKAKESKQAAEAKADQVLKVPTKRSISLRISERRETIKSESSSIFRGTPLVHILISPSSFDS
jgi:hypothetical protein